MFSLFLNQTLLGGGFKYFCIFTPNPGEMIQFDGPHIFQMGWGKTTNQIGSPGFFDGARCQLKLQRSL